MAERWLALVAAVAALSGCRTIVTREPVAFVDSTYHAFDGEEYVFAGSVLARSCEEYTTVVAPGSGPVVSTRVGDSDRPRTIQTALQQALAQKPGAVFLANVSIETEVIDRPFHPLQLCTVVSGAAMASKSAMKRAAAARASDADDDAPKRVAPPAAPAPSARAWPGRSVAGDADADDEDEK